MQHAASNLYHFAGQAEAPPSPPAPSMPLSSAVQSAQLGIPGIPGILDPSQAVRDQTYCHNFAAFDGRSGDQGSDWHYLTFFFNFFSPFNSELKLKVQTKAALKGWSALTGDKTGSTAQPTGPKKVETCHPQIKISSEAFLLSKK